MNEQNELEQLKKQVADLSRRINRLERLERALVSELMGQLIGDEAAEMPAEESAEQAPAIPDAESAPPGVPGGSRRDPEPDTYTIFERELDDDAFLDELLKYQEQKQARQQTQMVPDELQSELAGEILDDPSDGGVITLDDLDREKKLNKDLDDLGDEINRIFP